jgi:hypothetical protein
MVSTIAGGDGYISLLAMAKAIALRTSASCEI